MQPFQIPGPSLVMWTQVTTIEYGHLLHVDIIRLHIGQEKFSCCNVFLALITYMLKTGNRSTFFS